MFPRLLALALCLAATPAFAITVQEGDFYPELLVNDEAPFLMTGGQVDHLVLFGNGPYEIQGGKIDGIQLEQGNLFVRGGTIITGIGRTEEFSPGGLPEITFEGLYFRLFDRGKPERNSYVVEGWLSDGSFMSIALANSGERDTADLPIHFVIVPGGEPIGDADGDWDIDLSDLNIIRNNFGSAGEGDLDDSGLVDLADLNFVRNNFGVAEFTLDPNFSAEITESVTVSWPPLPGSTGNGVPEPSTLVLAASLVASAIVRTAKNTPFSCRATRRALP